MTVAQWQLGRFDAARQSVQELLKPFVAREVLAEHDENYMPAEVATAIKKAGQWKQKK